MPRFFWLMSDRKTVRELTFEAWREIMFTEFKKKTNSRLLVRVDHSAVYARKGERSLWISLEQLKQVLEEA